MQLTNSDRKLFADLDRARTRRDTGLFMAEGTKCVLDTLRHFNVSCLCATFDWLERHAGALPKSIDAVTVKRADLERMSHLSTPPEVLAIYQIPQYDIDEQAIASGITLLLDRVQDPGNLGTIMRIADWYGVRQIVCSPETVDVWSPKVVQSTMGAISRVKCFYTDLPEFIKAHSEVPVYGTFLDGSNIYAATLPTCAMIVMGNEGQGISPEVAECVSRRLLIPSYPPGEATSESLNVGMATAITLSEFRRNSLS
jgi:TrmH family RNA methyltransferase